MLPFWHCGIILKQPFHFTSSFIWNYRQAIYIDYMFSSIFLFQLTPDYECVNFTLRQHLPVARMSPYIPLEIRDWYSPGMLISLWNNQLSILNLNTIHYFLFFLLQKDAILHWYFYPNWIQSAFAKHVQAPNVQTADLLATFLVSKDPKYQRLSKIEII